MKLQQKPVKILLIGSKITTGGAELTLLSLAQWFYDQGLDTTAAFFYDPSGLHNQWQTTHQFPIINLHAWQNNSPAIINLFNLVKNWFGLVFWMKDQKFSAILSFTHDSNMLALPAAWLARIPRRFGSHHGRFSSMTKFRYGLHSLIINSRICSGLVAVSSHIRRQAMEEGIKPERITTIFNGIDVSKLKPFRSHELKREILGGRRGLLILNIGRLVVEKDQKNFIQAAAIVNKHNKDAIFTIVGDGYLKDELQYLITSLGIQDHVRLLGYRADIADFLDAADLFVLSSISEGLPISLLQAMGVGKPVISTRIGGVADVITDGENGLLVPVNDPQALAEAITSILNDKHRGDDFVAKGRQKIIRYFSQEKMGQSYKKLLVP